MSHQQVARKNIKKFCALHKITYSELSRRAGIPLNTLQGILYKSRKEPKVSTLLAIAKALKIKVDDLLK